MANVTLVMPSASPTGGAEEAFVQLLKSDAARQIDWQAIFLEDGPLVEQMKPFAKQSLVVQCGRTREFWKWWKASGQIAKLAKDFQSDLVLGWMTKGHVYGGLAAWRAGMPAAWFQMGMPEDGLLDRMSRWLPAEAVFTCSEFVAGLQRAKQPRANVIPIHLGVDLTRFDLHELPTPSQAREQLGLPATGPIIGIVGRLQRWKGMHTLIDAMPTVLRSHPDAHCVIVGGAYPAEPEYEKELHQQVELLGIHSSVTFAGAQSNVPHWMQAMDVFVHASRQEPFGIVVVEAMALGKAVVAAVPGGPSEMIVPEKNGLLFETGDSAGLAENLATVLSDPTLRKTIGDQAMDLARSKFSSGAFARRTVNALLLNIPNGAAKTEMTDRPISLPGLEPSLKREKFSSR